MRQVIDVAAVFISSLVVLYAFACGQQYAVTDLGEFAPSDVNEAGQVIGRAAGRPVMWKDGVIMPMQYLGYGGQPLRWSETGNGVSVGSIFYPSTGYEGAAQWDASGALTLLYTRDQLHGSRASSQNTHGATSGVHGRPDAAYGGPVQSAARWDNPNSLAIMDTRDGQWSSSEGIDGQGNMWGLDESYNSVVWDKSGRKSVIPGNPGRWTNIIAVNNHGVGVGHSTRVLLNGTREPFPVQATIAQGFSLLPVLSEGAQCFPIDINNAGAIIGSCWMPDGSTVPVMWEGGIIRRLNLEVPDGVRNLTLRSMNDKGVLLGAGFILKDGPYEYPISVTHGFLFSPVQEPPSLAMSLNRDIFGSGETLHASVERNDAPADLHVAVILPDGVTTLFLTNMETLSYIVSTIERGPYPVTTGASLTHTWHALNEAGVYHLIAALARPGSLADGVIHEGDILALDWKAIHFLPQFVNR